MKLWLFSVELFLFVGAGGVAAQIAPAQDSAGQAKPSVHAFTKGTIIYLSDFELDAQNVKTDKGGVIGEVRPGILERPRKREQHDPEAQARKLVDLMSKSIVADLQKHGYEAERLEDSDARPSPGAWVHGVFTEVDEGNRRRRAIIGFGAGQATMDLYVTLTDLAKPDKPLYHMDKQEDSGKKIGAVITMNPYVAAAKFVMQKNAPEKEVKKTASQIADEVVKRLNEYGAGS
jgi:Domain of unknown function (DUF4410)